MVMISLLMLFLLQKMAEKKQRLESLDCQRLSVAQLKGELTRRSVSLDGLKAKADLVAKLEPLGVAQLKDELIGGLSAKKDLLAKLESALGFHDRAPENAA